MNPELEAYQNEFIEAIPGFISIVDLNLTYLTVNNKLSALFNLEKENIKGMLAGGSCKKQSVQMQQLLDSPVGTEITWEYYFEGTCLAVSSKRHEFFIVNQAVDITERKQLEEKLKASNERNGILLRAIPEAIKSGAGRHSTDELEFLVKSLTENPIVDRQSIETLIRLEVQVRENSAKMLSNSVILINTSKSDSSVASPLALEPNTRKSKMGIIASSRERNSETIFRSLSCIISIPLKKNQSLLNVP